MKRLPLAFEGWPFIISAAAATVLLAVLNLAWAASASLILTLFVIWFFRDPERRIPADDRAFVSPADGKVIEIVPESGGGTKVGIFLSVFDVHVNRVPMDGRVEDVSYHKGRFLAAWKTITSEENERCSVTVRHRFGTVRFVQVAGLIARRIICRLDGGEQVRKGDRYGLIRFGSRLDTYFPPNVEVTVVMGQHVKGGESILGRWKEVD